MKCTFNESMVCRTCGYVAKRLPTHRVCGPVGTPPPWRPKHKLGDAVERAFSAVGVSKERVERWTRTAGKPGGCGCNKRKRLLNDLGDSVQIAGHNAAVLVGSMFKGKEPAQR